MSLNVEEMPWREIVRRYSVGLTGLDRYSISKGSIDEDIADGLMDIIENEEEKNIDQMVKQILDYFKVHGDYFDKIKFVMALYKNYDADLRKNLGLSPEEKKVITDFYSATRKALEDMFDSGVKKQMALVDLSSKRDGKFDYYIVTVNSLLGRPEGNEEKKAKQIDLLTKQGVSIYDLIERSTDEVLKHTNMDQQCKELLIRAAAQNTEDLAVEENGLKHIRKEDLLRETEYLLENNMQYLDIPGLILGALRVNFEALNNDDITKEEHEEIVAKIKKIMELGKKVMQKGIVEDQKDIEIFRLLKDLYKSMTVNGKLITCHNASELLDDLNSGKCKLSDLGQGVIEVIREIPLEIALKDVESFSFAEKKGWVKDTTMYEMISRAESVGTDVILYALSRNKLSKDELIQLYTKKHIPLEQIREIEQNIGQLVSLEDVVQTYLEEYETVHEEKENDNKEIEGFEELALKARTLQEPGFENENVEEALFGENIQDTETAMLMFYKNYLLDAETVVSSCGNQVIGALRPVDIRKLYLDKTITIEDIEQNLPRFNGDRAIHFICQIFPGKEYSEQFNRLIQFIDVQNEERSRKLGGHRTKGKSGEPISTARIGIEALSYKYQFYESLDVDYASEQSKNGYGIFILPNVKYKGTEDATVIIEPMMDKSHNTGKIMAAQDKAMWVLPQNLWNREKVNIVGRGNIVQTDVLRDLYDLLGKESLTKMHHNISSLEKIKEKEEEIKKGQVPKTGWPFRVFNQMRKGKQYTEEEIKTIMKLCIELEQSMIRE